MDMERVSVKTGSTCLNFNRLKKLREERCWSQFKLANVCSANRLSVSLSSIKRAETGKKVLYRTALDLATVFQVPVSDLRAMDTTAKSVRTSKLERVLVLESSAI